MTKLEQALEALIEDIANGGEYPDAEWRVARKFGVKADQLRDAYDSRMADDDAYHDYREACCDLYAGY